jgi:OmpA-OmpF porin, OOP family
MTKNLVFSFLSLIPLSCAFGQTSMQLENLGKNINTTYSEVRPTISADGKILYFVVEGNPKNTMYKVSDKAQDIWYSELDAQGSWGPAIQAPPTLNTQKSNAVFWVSPDGNRLLLRGAYENGKYGGRGISMTYKTASGWSTPEKLKIKNYEKMSRDAYSGATMANDGKTLFLYLSEEKNSFVNDIYVSHLTENNDWTEPMSLGAPVNTDDYDEITPFLAADGITLYFSSDRPGGRGDHDIWMSKRLDDSWKHWTEPVVLQSPVNTPKWDAYFTIDANAEYAYVASTQGAVGGTDLVRTLLDEKDKPKAVVLVYGKVFDGSTKKPMPNATLYYDLIPGEKNEGNALSGPDGDYKITLPYGKMHRLRASATNYFPVLDTIDFSSVGKYKEVHRDIYMYPVDTGALAGKPEIRRDIDSMNLYPEEYPIEEGVIVSLDNILFDFNKALLRSVSYKELDKAVRMLRSNPTMEIELSAHTDNIGGYSYNLRLSQDRAHSAREYLLSKGIDPKRIISKGYGEVKPISTNNSDEGRQLNRRVEFKIIKK